MTIPAFRKAVWAYYEEHGRKDLPWRNTVDPYQILVSEIMLQQTQVERVVPYYRKFVQRFPTIHSLARAPLATVLRQWQGLGYNRRAKFLHAAAKDLVEKYAGHIPHDAAMLESIWGIGPYTAHAVMTFALNHDAVFIETNIRTAVIYHFFADKAEVADEEIANVLKKALPRGHARAWYSALMDYGAHLKREGVQLNEKTKGYTKQAKFSGSAREARGAILKELAKRAATKSRLLGLLGDDRRDQLSAQLTKLVREDMVAKSGTRYHLPR